MSDGGKGSTQRPTDYDKFASNFDAIFRGKKMIETIRNEEGGKLYRCTRCTKLFLTKEEAEVHKHNQLGEGDK